MKDKVTQGNVQIAPRICSEGRPGSGHRLQYGESQSRE